MENQTILIKNEVSSFDVHHKLWGEEFDTPITSKLKKAERQNLYVILKRIDWGKTILLARGTEEEIQQTLNIFQIPLDSEKIQQIDNFQRTYEVEIKDKYILIEILRKLNADQIGFKVMEIGSSIWLSIETKNEQQLNTMGKILSTFQIRRRKQEG